MTKEEILAMVAGRELDKIVGEEVFGFEVKDFWPDEPKPSNYSYHMRVPCTDPKYKEAWELMPHYSTDISAARQVADKMFELGHDMNMLHLSSEFYPEAICRAALLIRLDEIDKLEEGKE